MAWKEELGAVGILELSVAVGGLTGLCLQMLALVPPAGEPSGHRPSAPPTTPAASSGARRQSQVLLGGLLRREGGRGEPPEQGIINKN